MSVTPVAAVLGALSHGAEMLLARLSGVSLFPLVLALTLHVAKLAARARGWHNIVRVAYPAEQIRFREALAAFLAGVGVSACFPARAGQLVRLRLLRTRVESSTFPGLVATLLAESVFDAILTALLIGIAVWRGFAASTPGSAFIRGPVAQHPVIATLVVASVALAGGWLGYRLRSRIRSLLRDARRGLAVFAHPITYVRSVASWQALGWALRVGSSYWFLVAFHVPASLSVAVLVVAVQLIAASVPITPGGAGPQQALLVVALSASAATVLGFSIGTQAATLLSDLMLGAASMIFLTGSLHWHRVTATRDTARICSIAATRATGEI